LAEVKSISIYSTDRKTRLLQALNNKKKGKSRGKITVGMQLVPKKKKKKKKKKKLKKNSQFCVKIWVSLGPFDLVNI
jgi:hypothetical protein